MNGFRESNTLTHALNNELQSMLLLTSLLKKQILESPGVSLEALRVLAKLEASQDNLRELNCQQAASIC
jgi:hypothetical protein